ncbi:hypothetical protein [Microbacterium sp. YY-01]
MLDAVFLSHAINWLIGVMTVVGGVLCIGALLSMGRTPSRKN